LSETPIVAQAAHKMTEKTAMHERRAAAPVTVIFSIFTLCFTLWQIAFKTKPGRTADNPKTKNLRVFIKNPFAFLRSRWTKSMYVHRICGQHLF
jgi:hypothetical protein